MHIDSKQLTTCQCFNAPHGRRIHTLIGLVLGWNDSILTFLEPTSSVSQLMLIRLAKTRYGVGARLKQPHNGALHGSLIAKKH